MDATLEDLELPVKVLKQRIVRAEVLNQAGLSLELIFDYAPKTEVAGCLDDLASVLWRRAGRIRKQRR
jgi:hypothetical protein